jgi:hypothetical protein
MPVDGQRDGDQHLHQTRVVIVVHVGAVDPAAEARRPQPIQLSVRGNPLYQGEGCKRETVNGQDQCQSSDLRRPAQALHRQETKDSIGAVQPHAGESLVTTRGEAGCELHRDQSAKHGHWQKQRVADDLQFTALRLLHSP